MDRKMNVLIVDDHCRSRQSLRALIATWPAIGAIREAANGAAVLRMARDFRLDLGLHPGVYGREPVTDVLDDLDIGKSRIPPGSHRAKSLFLQCGQQHGWINRSWSGSNVTVCDYHGLFDASHRFHCTFYKHRYARESQAFAENN